MKKIFLTLFILILIGTALLIAAIVSAIYSPLTINYTLTEIKQGDSGHKVAATFHDAGIIKNELLFYLLIKHKNVDRSLKAGHYLFSGEYNMITVLDKIVSGEILVHRVTIPEGISIYRTMKILSDNELGNYETLLSKAKDPDFAKEITGFDIETLEGFLYPDTYIFGYTMTEERILMALVNNFFERLNENHIDIEDKEKFYKDLILASIVEREAIYNDEKPIIAGVFTNRLRRNMRLQADPTAVYHLEPEFIHRNRVTYADLRTVTPYNTYQISGLPPHPICSPSIIAIYAAQNPEPTDFLFFFADGSGRHTFTRTYDEHSTRLRRMRQERRENN